MCVCDLTAVQLAQVESALVAEPDNAELSSLRDELANLISLLKTQQDQASASRPAAKAPVHSYRAGDECMARYQADGRWYPAKITAVAGSAEHPVYSILFTKYKTTEMVSAADLRPRQVHANAAEAPAPGAKPKSSAAARPMTHDERMRDMERKRVRKEKKMQREAAKNREHDQKQSAWQKFQAKAVKKRYVAPGEQSQFKTSDDPFTKVGTSGRGWTPQAPRQRPTYERDAGAGLQ